MYDGSFFLFKRRLSLVSLPGKVLAGLSAVKAIVNAVKWINSR